MQQRRSISLNALSLNALDTANQVLDSYMTRLPTAAVRYIVLPILSAYSLFQAVYAWRSASATVSAAKQNEQSEKTRRTSSTTEIMKEIHVSTEDAGSVYTELCPPCPAHVIKMPPVSTLQAQAQKLNEQAALDDVEKPERFTTYYFRG
jgi:hypothetical protein